MCWLSVNLLALVASGHASQLKVMSQGGELLDLTHEDAHGELNVSNCHGIHIGIQFIYPTPGIIIFKKAPLNVLTRVHTVFPHIYEFGLSNRTYSN